MREPVRLSSVFPSSQGLEMGSFRSSPVHPQAHSVILPRLNSKWPAAFIHTITVQGSNGPCKQNITNHLILDANSKEDGNKKKR